MIIYETPAMKEKKWLCLNRCKSIKMTIHTLAVNYPLVNIQETMENHHFQWVNPLFLWPFSMSQTVGLPEGTLFRQKTKCLLGNTSHKKIPGKSISPMFFFFPVL